MPRPSSAKPWRASKSSRPATGRTPRDAGSCLFRSTCGSCDMPGTVVITGASSGFGEAFALAFGRLGHPLVLGARRTDRLAKVAEAARKAGSPRAIALPLDVRVRESIHKFAVAAELETPEILINNAGGALGRAPVAEVEDDDLVGMIEANLTGLLRMTRELLPGLIRRKKGHVINISSLAAHGVYEGGGVYAPGKHVLHRASHDRRLRRHRDAFRLRGRARSCGPA